MDFVPEMPNGRPTLSVDTVKSHFAGDHAAIGTSD